MMLMMSYVNVLRSRSRSQSELLCDFGSVCGSGMSRSNMGGVHVWSTSKSRSWKWSRSVSFTQMRYAEEIGSKSMSRQNTTFN